MIRSCDNHYSLASIGLQSFKDSESVVKWHVLGVCIIATLIAKKKWLYRDPRFQYLVLVNSVITPYKLGASLSRKHSTSMLKQPKLFSNYLKNLTSVNLAVGFFLQQLFD